LRIEHQKVRACRVPPVAPARENNFARHTGRQYRPVNGKIRLTQQYYKMLLLLRVTIEQQTRPNCKRDARPAPAHRAALQIRERYTGSSFRDYLGCGILCR
jgi:hypothetical protein